MIKKGQVWQHNREARFMIVHDCDRYNDVVIAHRCDHTGRPLPQFSRAGRPFVPNYSVPRHKFGSLRHDGYKLVLDVQ